MSGSFAARRATPAPAPLPTGFARLKTRRLSASRTPNTSAIDVNHSPQRVESASPPGAMSVLSARKKKPSTATSSAAMKASRSESAKRVFAGFAMGQTFSTSGLPSRPEGRKMSTMARIEKAATSLYSTVK